MSSAALHVRARAARARALVRAWEYRQREHARGAWFRLGRLLAGAESACEIAPGEADRLRAEGFVEEPVGVEFEPQKRFFVIPASRAERIAARRALPMRLGREMFAARCVALVPFP